MVAQLELILLGFAVVVDSVLLLALLERVNRPHSPIWITTLVAFIWLAHAGGFSHVLIRGAEVEPFVMLDRVNVALIAVALLAIPSALLHGAARLNLSLHNLRPHWDWRYAIAYLPCWLAPWVFFQAWTTDSRILGTSFEPIVRGYLLLLLIMNVASAVLFLRYRTRIEAASTRKFFLQLAILLVGVSLLVTSYGWFARDTVWDLPLRLAVILSPLSLITLFLWYALRDKLLPLVFERALVYGGSLVLIMLFHQVLVIPLAESMQRKSSFDVILVEGIILVGIILAWPPLRNRVREALRYLLSRNIFQVREAMRKLSLQISQQDSRSLDDLCNWFTRSSCELLSLEQVWLWFDDARVGAPISWKSKSTTPCAAEITDADMQSIYGSLSNLNESVLGRASLRDPSLVALCERLNIQFVFRCQFRELHGLVLLGPRIRSDRFSEEQRASLSLLFDQFAATLFNRMVEQDRLRAERQAAQQEKLAVLGLMSGSLAHEIRNPLSSIRTIASLLREDLADQPAQANDVGIIIHELDRLTSITQRLLDYSKPSDDRVVGINVQRVIERLFHILEPWGAQQQVKLVASFSGESPLVRATDASVSEILFNLLRNAIEATRSTPNACVTVTTEAQMAALVVRVMDNGPGIDPTIRDNIYRPFVTSKEYGTGLGLYIAAERVRSIQGTIECRSAPETGTVFELHLPLVDA
jgi:nitrogen-specific signal transduction histidine kinase